MVRRQESETGSWTLGIPFNKAYYSIYDQEKYMIGFIGASESVRTMEESIIQQSEPEVNTPDPVPQTQPTSISSDPTEDPSESPHDEVIAK